MQLEIRHRALCIRYLTLGKISRVEKEYLNSPSSVELSIFQLRLVHRRCLRWIVTWQPSHSSLRERQKGGQVFFQADEGWEDSGDFPAELRKPWADQGGSSPAAETQTGINRVPEEQCFVPASQSPKSGKLLKKLSPTLLFYCPVPHPPWGWEGVCKKESDHPAGHLLAHHLFIYSRNI